MQEKDWPPDVVGRMTLPQLVCLLNEKPPGAREPLRSYDAYVAALAEQERKENEW